MAQYRPLAWRNAPLILYHGTVRSSADSVLRGVDPQYFRPRRDFGRGFYVTTLRRQAEFWAASLADQALGADAPAVVAFTVDRDQLASLDLLAFVRGDFDDEAYWSFVWRCRQGDVDHGRAVGGGWYDVVVGPVAAFWRQRALYAGADQLSFHTPAAVSLLNQSVPRLVT